MNVLADACPACFPGDAPAAMPAAVRAEPDGALVANYTCPPCGLQWVTRWNLADAWPASRTYCRPFPLLDDVISLLASLLDGEEMEVA